MSVVSKYAKRDPKDGVCCPYFLWRFWTYLKRYPAGHLYNSGLPFSILHSQNRAQSLACEKIPWFEHWKSNVGATITVNWKKNIVNVLQKYLNWSKSRFYSKKYWQNFISCIYNIINKILVLFEFIYYRVSHLKLT